MQPAQVRPTPTTWAEALAHAKAETFAGRNDWRMPNIKELATLVAWDRHNPAINIQIFSDVPSGDLTFFWSSSPVAAPKGYALARWFKQGTSIDVQRTSSYVHTRLVTSPAP